jgi:hypothetical protein
MNDTTTPTKALQVANTPSGEYDVMKPLPYPFHVEPDGSIARQDFWRGEPLRLLGFQHHANRHTVDESAEAWLAGEVEVGGMYPVFLDADGTMWNHTFPVER